MNTIEKVSEITYSDIAEYIRVENEQSTLENMLTIAKAFIKSYTGLNDEQVDEHADFVIAAFILCQDMWDNRTLYVDNNNLNKVVETILGMHSVNLL